jgi:hypothetical protein
MNVAAFIAGFRQGRGGDPPSLPIELMEQENYELESTKPNVDNYDPAWVWRLLGWGLGQLVAMYELSGFGSPADRGCG